MEADHPDPETHPGSTEGHRCADDELDTDGGRGHDQRSTDQSRDRVQPATQDALGTCRISTSRSVPPPTPVSAPRMIACAGPAPTSSALPAPVTANRLSPAASSTSIAL